MWMLYVIWGGVRYGCGVSHLVCCGSGNGVTCGCGVSHVVWCGSGVTCRGVVCNVGVVYYRG